MKAQISLTPTESKKLISKAVAEHPDVKEAYNNGTIVLHPSSSTYFIVEELMNSRPKTNEWVCGIVSPKGTCVEMGMGVGGELKGLGAPKEFSKLWVIKQREMTTDLRLGELLEELGPNDIYIKGVNALDPNGNVGVLVGNPAKGGTIGLVTRKAKENGFQMIYPVGLEKLIPLSIKQAKKEAQKEEYEYSMGMACGVWQCNDAMTITEPKALEILTGSEAIPISAGGLGGAEGSVTMIIKGKDDQVKQAINYSENCKGVQLPQVRTFNCEDCPFAESACEFPLKGREWIIES